LVDLRQARHRAAHRVTYQRRHGNGFGAVVGHLIVDLIAEHDELVGFRELRDAFAHRTRVYRAGRIVRVDDHNGASLARDQRGDLFRVRDEVVFGPARVVHGLAAIQRDGRRPQWIVGARNEHLVTGIEQRAQAKVDELAHAIANEYFFGADRGDASRLLLHDDGFARRENALLVAVALRNRHILDHGKAHGFGRTETESPGVADVERHDFVALALELLGAPGETSTNLVLDVAQAFAGADLGFLGHRDSQKRET
jgi:hypothetical protein